MKHEANIISFLSQVLELSKTYSWIVIMCPTGSDCIKKMHVGMSVIQPNTYTGRTTRVEGSHAKVSIVDPSDTLFIPPDQTYYLAYAGWSEDLISDPKSMALWRERSAGVVSL